MGYRWGFLLIGWLCSLPVWASNPWNEHTLPDEEFKQYGKHYMVSLPDGYDPKTENLWPVIVFLHGQGEWGDDLNILKKRGIPQYLNEGHKIPAIVIAPQSPQNQTWHPLFINAVMEDAAKRYHFDNSRIYLTGLSMGGIGSWNMAIAYPHRFAAIAPIAGCLMNDIAADSLGNDLAPPEQLVPMLERIKDTPAWVFHGDRDFIVLTELGKRSASLFEQGGGKAKVTLYPMTDHDSWSQTYFDNPNFYSWLFAQNNHTPKWHETPTTIDAHRYVGTYVDSNGSARAEVSALKNGQISMRLLNENSEEELIAIDEKHFISSSFVYFEGNEKHMSKVILPGIGTWTFKP